MRGNIFRASFLRIRSPRLYFGTPEQSINPSYNAEIIYKPRKPKMFFFIWNHHKHVNCHHVLIAKKAPIRKKTLCQRNMIKSHSHMEFHRALLSHYIYYQIIFSIDINMINHQLYADDTQIYMSLTVSNAKELSWKVATVFNGCVGLDDRVYSKLKLNPSKTEFLLIVK